MAHNHFVKLPESLLLELESRGIAADKIAFSVKADLNEENFYADTYLLLTKEELLVVSGMEEIVQANGNKRKHRCFHFIVKQLDHYSLTDIESLKIDRQISTARYILHSTNGGKQILCKFSILYFE